MHEDSTRKQRITSFVLFLFSLVYLYGCLGLKIGRAGNPGPGFMPLVVGILLVFFSGLGLAQTLRRREASNPGADGDRPATAGILFPLGTAACVLIYPFLLKSLKFIPSTFLVMFVMLVMNRYKNLMLNGLIALVIALASFAFFSMVLGVVLPMGKLEILVFQLR